MKAGREGKEEEGREGEKERGDRRGLCERERRRWSVLNENAIVQNGHLREGKAGNGPIEKEGERREMEGGSVVENEGEEFAVFGVKERERRGKKREWGRGTEREREERENRHGNREKHTADHHVSLRRSKIMFSPTVWFFDDIIPVSYDVIVLGCIQEAPEGTFKCTEVDGHI